MDVKVDSDNHVEEMWVHTDTPTSRCNGLFSESGNDFQRPLHVVAVNVEMRDPTQTLDRTVTGALCAGCGENIVRLQMRYEAISDVCLNIHENHIGLRRMHGRALRKFCIGCHNSGQPVRQFRSQSMIVGQAMHMMLQRMNAGCSEHAGLAHAAAKHLARASCFGVEGL